MFEHPEFQIGVQICPSGQKSIKRNMVMRKTYTEKMLSEYQIYIFFYLFKVHTPQCGIHRFNYTCHGLGYLVEVLKKKKKDWACYKYSQTPDILLNILFIDQPIKFACPFFNSKSTVCMFCLWFFIGRLINLTLKASQNHIPY